jgi:hypothetical protein
MWTSRTKDDLIIEVWERLDCENVGAIEIEAIETAVAARFGAGAVDSPMVIARLLADEGAELRHAEILALFVSRREPDVKEAANDLRFDFESLPAAIETAGKIAEARRKFLAAEDHDRLKRLRERIMDAKNRATDGSLNPRLDVRKRAELAEISEWLTLWLQTPEIFDNWLSLRINSRDYRDKFIGESEAAS